MKTLYRMVLGISFLFLLGCQTLNLTNQENVDLTFIHWNDFHAANTPYLIKPTAQDTFKPYFVGGAAYFKGYLDSLTKVNKNPITVFAGDEFQGSPISGMTTGQSQMDIVEYVKTDVLTLGNHEFDYTDNRLLELVKKSNMNYITSNIRLRSDSTLILPPYSIREVGGLKIAFIGGMTDELFDVSLPFNLTHIYITSIIQSIKKSVEDIKSSGQKINLFVAVTHNGVEPDKLLAQAVPDLDIIIGGHSHTSLYHEIKVGKTIIVQAGYRGRYVGEFKVTYSRATKSISDYHYQLIETKNDRIKPDTYLLGVVQKQEDFVGKALDEVIGELKTDWIVDEDGESNLGNFEADAFRDYAKTDIALVNTGGLRKDLMAGPIKIRDIWEINPFNNSLVTLNITGKELKSVAEFSLNQSESFNQISGFKIIAIKGGRRSHQVLEVTINGQSVDPNKTYSVVVNNYMGLQMKRTLGLDPATHPITYLNAVDKDVVIDAVKKQKVIDQPKDGRIEYVTRN